MVFTHVSSDWTPLPLNQLPADKFVRIISYHRLVIGELERR